MRSASWKVGSFEAVPWDREQCRQVPVFSVAYPNQLAVRLMASNNTEKLFLSI